jgi:bla regulator protein BlaR1
MPDQKFDVLVTIGEDPQRQMQNEIKQLFGLVGRREARPANVLMLAVAAPKAPGLKVHADNDQRANGGGFAGSGMVGSGAMSLQNTGILQFISNLQGYFDEPIVDRTGLTGDYDITLHWPRASDAKSRAEAVKTAMLNQLGLTLSPGIEQTEMLVLEKAP